MFLPWLGWEDIEKEGFGRVSERWTEAKTLRLKYVVSRIWEKIRLRCNVLLVDGVGLKFRVVI